MTQFDDETHAKAPLTNGQHEAATARRPFWRTLTVSFAIGCAFALWFYTTDLNAPAPPANVAALGPESGQKVLPVKFDGAVFAIAEHQFLWIEQSPQSEAQSIEIALRWPPAKLAFLNPRDEPASGLSLNDGLFVSIQRRGNNLTAQDRVTTIYPKYLAGASEIGPDDLSMHSFAEGTVYEGQKLYVGQQEAMPVHYLCFEDGQNLAPDLCRGERPMWDRFTVIYRFHRSHLDDWRSIEETVTELQSTLRQAQ